MIELTIESVRISLMNYQRVVILKEKDAGRYLPIWIGAAEADAIAVRLQEVNVPRPMTHDLLANVMGEFGGVVERIVVNDLSNDTFYARIHVTLASRQIEFDARPSDAIALAVRAAAPIFVEDGVIEKAGVTMPADGEPVPAAEDSGGRRSPPPVREEELKGMSAFRDFIQGLDLDDFDKG